MKKLRCAIEALLDKISMEFSDIKECVNHATYVAERLESESIDESFAYVVRLTIDSLTNLAFQALNPSAPGGVSEKKLQALMLAVLRIKIGMIGQNTKNYNQVNRSMKTLFDDYIDLLYLEKYGPETSTTNKTERVKKLQDLKEENHSLLADSKRYIPNSVIKILSASHSPERLH